MYRKGFDLLNAGQPVPTRLLEDAQNAADDVRAELVAFGASFNAPMGQLNEQVMARW